MNLFLKSCRKIAFLFILLSIIFVLIISCQKQSPQKQVNSDISLDSLIKKLINFKINGYDRNYEDMKTSQKIVSFGDTAVSKLLVLLKDTNAYVQYRAERTLELYKTINDKHLIEMKEPLINGNLFLAHFVAKIGTDFAIQILIEALKKNKESESTLTYSFKILGQKCLPQLIDLFDCNNKCDEDLLYAVSRIFGLLGKEAIPAINSLDSLAKDKRNSFSSRTYSIMSLGNIGVYAQSTDKDLYQIWKDEPAKYSRTIMMALVGMKSPLALEPYIKKIENDKSVHEKILAFRDISEIGLNANKAGEKIMKYLKNGDWDVRVAAARTMGFIGYKPAIPELQSLLFVENDWRLNYVAVLSLEMLNASNALKSLKEIETNHWYSPVREASKHAIAKIRNLQYDTLSKSNTNFAFDFFSYEDVEKKVENCKFESDPFMKKFLIWKVTLIGEDHGEWGGTLKFINSNGKKEVLIKDNIKSIIEFNGKIIVITGLAHMSCNNGAIYQLSQDKKGVKVKKIIILPGSPFKIKKLNEDEIIIATYHGGTVILTKEMKLKEAICK